MEIDSEETDEADLLDIFGKFGEVTRVQIIPYFKDECYGAIVFRDTEIAANALAGLIDKKLDHNLLYTTRKLDMSNTGGFVDKK